MGSYLNPGNKGFRESLKFTDLCGQKRTDRADERGAGYTRKICVREQAKAVWKIDGSRYVDGIL